MQEIINCLQDLAKESVYDSNIVSSSKDKSAIDPLDDISKIRYYNPNFFPIFKNKERCIKWTINDIVHFCDRWDITKINKCRIICFKNPELIEFKEGYYQINISFDMSLSDTNILAIPCKLNVLTPPKLSNLEKALLLHDEMVFEGVNVANKRKGKPLIQEIDYHYSKSLFPLSHKIGI